MASEDTRKCVTYIWKLENGSYHWENGKKWIGSPVFVADETKWKLYLFPRCGNGENYVGLSLGRPPDKKRTNNIKIDYELVFLAADGTVLKSVKRMKRTFLKSEIFDSETVEGEKSFFINRSAFVLQGTLAIRCRVWKSVGEISEAVQCMARTRIGVEKRSFMWKVGNFSALEPEKKYSYQITSSGTGEQLMTLDLFLTGGLMCDETIRFAATPNDPRISFSTFLLSLVDASGNGAECLQNEFKFEEVDESKQFTKFFSKAKIMEMKGAYLPNDVLSLRCECALSFGIVLEEIEKIYCDGATSESNEPDDLCFMKKNLSTSKVDLIDNFKSMLNNSCHADIKLRTSTKTYPAHKCVLSARSPVFNAMFANEMKENINHCVDIKDLDDDTVLRMLRYIYSAEVEELEWVSASELYEAADKYEIVRLKDICSSYLKTNLCGSNVCYALVLADLHQDSDLKSFAQNFILRQGNDIFNSEDWKKLMETQLKLAAETMCLKFKE